MTIRADVETINQAATDVHNTKQQIDGQLKSLRNLLEEIQGSWKGAAAGAFQGVMQSYDEEATTLMTALEGIGEQLSATGAQIDENEQSGADALGKFNVL